MSYSFLGNRLTNLWGSIFGAQGASIADLATRFGAAGNVLRDGQAINYTLRYRNRCTHLYSQPDPAAGRWNQHGDQRRHFGQLQPWRAPGMPWQHLREC